MKSLKDILSQRDWDKGKHLKYEWQDFAYRMALALNDLKHRSLYMKLAKTEDRKILQKALNFSKDYKSGKAKLFMWKLARLREGIND